MNKMNNINILSLFLLIFFDLTLAGAGTARAEDRLPITVYTGVLHSEKTGHDILARMTLIEDAKAGIQAYAATVTLFIGNEFSNEYATASYDSVYLFPNSHEILLQRNDAFVSRRLPTIRLKFSDDGLKASGRFIAGQFGDIGPIDFALGWRAPNDRSYQFIEPIGGIYDARCPFGTVELRSLHVVASRIYSDVTSNEGLPGAIQYIANGYCSGPAYAGDGNCAHARSGLFNFYDDTLVFNRGGVACRRTNSTELACNLLGTVEALKPNLCTFVKRDVQQTQSQSQDSTIRPPVTPIAWRATPLDDASNNKTNCESFNRIRRGFLTHLRDGRKQLISLRLDSFANPDGSGEESCMITGGASLEFPTGEVLNFILPATQHKTKERKITLMSEASSDAAITIDTESFTGSSSTGGHDGYWYSRLFGAFAAIHFIDEGTTGADVVGATESFAYGANGHYDCGPKVMSLVLFASPSSNARPVYWDAFNQKKYSGSVAGFNVEHPAEFPLPGMTTPILESSFDYFSNSLVLDGTSLYTGYADNAGLHLWGGPSRRYVRNRGLDEQHCLRQMELPQQ